MTDHITTEQAAPNSDRDTNGRFGKGNSGGPGNPFARKSAALRQALLDAVTPEDITGIATILVFNAKAGDLASVKLLFQYVIGKPQPAVDPDKLDLDELALLQLSSLPGEAVNEFTGKIPAALAVLTLRALVPDITNQLLAMIAATVTPPAQETSAPPPAPAEQAPPPSTEKTSARPPSPNGSNGRTAPPSDGENTQDFSDEAPSTNDSNGSLAALARILPLLMPVERDNHDAMAATSMRKRR